MPESRTTAAFKYWSDRSPGMEEMEVTFADEATRAIINAHRPALATI
ncbi:TPA: hypothetical protein G8N99_005394 [Salmonella enterica]|nr:hypothetical protein [Salmonella enterica]